MTNHEQKISIAAKARSIVMFLARHKQKGSLLERLPEGELEA